MLVLWAQGPGVPALSPTRSCFPLPQPGTATGLQARICRPVLSPLVLWRSVKGETLSAGGQCGAERGPGQSEAGAASPSQLLSCRLWNWPLWCLAKGHTVLPVDEYVLWVWLWLQKQRRGTFRDRKQTPLETPACLRSWSGHSNYSFLHTSLLSSPGLWPRSPESVSVTITNNLCLGFSGLSCWLHWGCDHLVGGGTNWVWCQNSQGWPGDLLPAGCPYEGDTSHLGSRTWLCTRFMVHPSHLQGVSLHPESTEAQAGSQTYCLTSFSKENKLPNCPLPSQSVLSV